MALLVNLFIFLGACIILVLSGALIVKSLLKIASFLKFSEFIIGFIIMAFATSLPELFVGISSSLAKDSALLLGTVIGSNIADLTFVIGISIILARGIKARKHIKIDTIHMFLIMLLPLILMLIGNKISRIDGIILVFVFLYYSWRMLKEKKRFKKEIEDNVKRWHVIFSSFLFIFSLVLLFLGAKYVVEYAKILSIELSLPIILIGLFLVAFGTSLPELVFETNAVLSGHSELALGDLIGSVIVNSTLVLGVTALIYPITANFILFLSSSVFMITVGFLFLTFIYSGSKLDWREGASLVLLYALFIIVEFYIKSIGGF